MKKSGHTPASDGIYETPSDYDPLAVNMGQLTVFRFTLKCKCNEELLRQGVHSFGILSILSKQEVRIQMNFQNVVIRTFPELPYNLSQILE